ncbi:hypothetical protein TNCV_3315201 [Trichonephila clavipes]|nr:hypothetical protein TNCV_3315201 [Trichonephila clavipes]
MFAAMRLQMAWPVRAAIKILHLVATLLFKKLLPGLNKVSVPLGSRPLYMNGMKETVLVLLCLRHCLKVRCETTLARLRSGPSRAQRHVAGLKVCPPCPNYNGIQATPTHILACISCS